MTRFVARVAVGAGALWLAAWITPGMEIRSVGTLFLASILLGLVNAIVKPVLVVLTLPVTILTLGLFLLVINAAMLGLVAWLLAAFTLDGFVPALIGSILVSIVSGIGMRLIRDDD